jgi:hypothetical protein
MHSLCVKPEPALASTAPQREQGNSIYFIIFRGGREKNFNSWRRGLFEKLTRNMDPENSFSCTLKSATESYPQLDKSTGHLHNFFLLRHIIILSIHLLLDLFLLFGKRL